MSNSLKGKILSIATGHDLSVAVIENGKLLAEHNLPIDRGHAEAVVPTISAVLNPFGGSLWRADHIVVEVGPGSFTGLRVGLAAATALSIAWKAKLRGVRSTQLVGAQLRHVGLKGRLLVALGAPRGQVWLEGFEAEGLQSAGEPISVLPATAPDYACGYEHVGGTAEHMLTSPNLLQKPMASSILHISEDLFIAPEPLYVRVAE